MKTYNHYLCEVDQLGNLLESIGEEGETLVSSFCVAGTDQIILITEKSGDLKSVKKFLKIPEEEGKEKE